jgi:hypothetical protein
MSNYNRFQGSSSHHHQSGHRNQQRVFDRNTQTFNANQRGYNNHLQRSRDADHYHDRHYPGEYNNYERRDYGNQNHFQRRQVQHDPFNDFFNDPSNDFELFPFGRSFFPNQNRRMQERRPQGPSIDDLFLNIHSVFDDLGQSSNSRRRNPGLFDLMPSINLFLDNGIRRTSNRRRRDENLLEMFFGRNENFDAFNFDPFHDFFNSRQSRGLDIGEILSHLSMMSSGQQGQSSHPGNRSRLKDVKMTSGIIAENQACTVCQEDFKVGENTKKLPCEHYFHDECINPWLQSQNTCPMCRATV